MKYKATIYRTICKMVEVEIEAEDMDSAEEYALDELSSGIDFNAEGRDAGVPEYEVDLEEIT